MKITLETNTYGFYINISNALAARELKRNLPCESRIEKSDDKVCLKMSKIIIGLPESSIYPRRGDVIWNNGNLCVYLSDISASSNLSFKGIKIGYTSVSVNELLHLKQNDKISVLFVDESKTCDTRILSQGEIDELVKSLLKK